METADPNLVEYYKSINRGFKNWADSYSEAPIIRINRDDFDFESDMGDRSAVLDLIETKLVDLGYLTEQEFVNIVEMRSWGARK